MDEYIPMPGLDSIVLDDLKEGRIVRALCTVDEEKESSVQYPIYHLRKAMTEIMELYKNNASKKEFVKAIDKFSKDMNQDINDFLDNPNKFDKEKILKVIKRQDKGDEITITFKKIDVNERKELIKSISSQLVDRVPKETLKGMFEQALLRLNDVAMLKKAETALKEKKDVEIKGKRGCYYLVIDDVELMMVGV